MNGIHVTVNKFCFVFLSFRATPVARGGSQARGLIRAVATSLRQRHNKIYIDLVNMAVRILSIKKWNAIITFEIYVKIARIILKTFLFVWFF